MDIQYVLESIYKNLDLDDLAKNIEIMTHLLNCHSIHTNYINACRDGRLHLLKWLFYNRNEELTPDIAEHAAKNGRINVLEWLKTKDINCTYTAFNLAIENSHNKTIYWIYYNFSNINIDSRSIEIACEKGNIEIVKWLYNKKIKPSEVAMDLAAANNHLDIVKFLYENTEIECTHKAVEEAAKKGNLKMIKWLYKNMKKTITKDDIYYAAHYGHFKVVKWLHYNNPYADTFKAILAGEWEGNTEIACWLKKHYTLKHTLRINLLIAKRNMTFLVIAFRRLICKVKTDLNR